MNARTFLTGMCIAVISAATACAASRAKTSTWSAAELEIIRSLSLSQREPLAADPSNRFSSDTGAALLGKALFFDTRLSSNGRVSCATCHQPDRQFQDGIPLSAGVGRTNRRAMPITGTAHSPWMFWDGRKDSQWSQALGPLESGVEHGGTRAQYAHVISSFYADAYARVFGALPDLKDVPAMAGPVNDRIAHAAWDAMQPALRDSVTRVFVNIGKAIAAFERTVEHRGSRFDDYVAGAATLTPDEIAGLRIFIGKGNCTQCHNGALFTDDSFHNTGVPAARGLPEDRGRELGAMQVLGDEFNCRSRWSDAGPGHCAELDYLVPEGDALIRAFKTPSLRDVARRAPYMHAGQIASLEAVVDHYSAAPAAPFGRTEVHALKLNRAERAQLVAYLNTLNEKD